MTRWNLDVTFAKTLLSVLFPCLSLCSDGTDQVISGPPGVPGPRARAHLRRGGTWRSGACRCVCRAAGLEGEAQQVLITQTLTAHCMNLSTSDCCWHISVLCLSCQEQRKFSFFLVCVTKLNHLCFLCVYCVFQCEYVAFYVFFFNRFKYSSLSNTVAQFFQLFCSCIVLHV